MSDNGTSQNNTTTTPLTGQLAADDSIKAFTSSLLVNTAVGLAVFVGFCIVRYWSKKIYQPRTYLVTKDIRSPELPSGAFSWITASFKVKDTELLDKVGLDAYMYLRFLRMSAFFFAGCTALSVPILIPINMVGGINASGLRRLNIGNIPVNEEWRFWFHLLLTYIFTTTTILLLWREMQEYTRRRHAYLMSEKHAKTPQSRTILVTAIPKGLNTEEALYNIFNRFPGGVTKIWLNRHPKSLVKLCRERDSVVKKLEMAEYNFIRSAYGKKSKKDPEIKEPQRPIGKISSVPCTGDKVDLIDFYTEQLCQLNQQIQKAQQIGIVDSLNSAFIQFRSQFAAHSAVQTVVHPKPFRMAPMYAEISPLDVVWDNMNLDTLTRKGRHMVVLVISTVMILLWTIPTIVISSLANMQDIVRTFKFLAFLSDLPAAVVGIIQGVLPPLLIAGLMALLPVLLTMLATYEGHVRQSSITLSVMSKYFLFLVVNVLLISTLSGGAVKTVVNLVDVRFQFDSVVRLFSENLPNASTFFVTYVLLRAFTGPALELLQVAPLLLNFLFTHLLAKSPRQIWDVQGRLECANYGVLFPPQTLMFCIGILYSTMAPLVLPFVTFYFTMHYFVFRHQFLYVYLQPVEMGGLAFPKAVKQVFTGLFISQITLFGIFLMKLSYRSPAQLILLILLLIATAFALSNMNEAFDPLVTFLPVALFSEDLHVDREGVVTDGHEKPTKSRRQDEEEAEQGCGPVMQLDNLSKRNLTSEMIPAQEESQPQFTMRKQEYCENGDIDDAEVGPDDSTPASQEGILMFTEQTLHRRHPHQHQNSPNYISERSLTMPNQSQTQPMQDDLKRPDLQIPQYHSSLRILARPVSFFARPASFSSSRPVSFVDRPSSFRVEGMEGQQIPEATQADVELEQLQDQAYCHPAIYDVQKPVWLPQDDRGLVRAEIGKLSSRGIIVATDGAVLHASTGKAQVDGIIYAPGEENRYRLERGE